MARQRHDARPAGPRKRFTAALVGLLAGSVLTACSDPVPEPDGAAQALAQSLASGDFAAAPLSAPDRSAAAAQAEEVLGALSSIPRDVVVGDVGEVDDEGEQPSASVMLEWSWDVDASETDWTYTVPASLTLVDDVWTTSWSRDLLALDLGPAGVLAIERTQAARGDVTGTGEAPIVTDRPVFRVGIDKTRILEDQWEGAATSLATALAFDAPAEFAARVLAAGPRAFVEAIVLRQEDPGAVDLDALRAIEGVALAEDELPLAPTPTFARALLGRVGEVTAEIVDASDGALVAGDMAGLSGLQQQYDPILRGTPGTTIAVVDGESTTAVFSSEPVPGTDLGTTLDPALQTLAEEILAPVQPASAIVAIRPSTGEVLAAASGPGSAGYNTATLGQYAPGSTFKIVTTLALLRAGVSLEDTLACSDSITVDGREFHNYPGYPASFLSEIPLEQVVAQSCNTALIGARDQVPAAAVADAAAALGLAGSGAVGFPAFGGSVPVDAIGTDHAASLIGQGRITVSPLAMALVAASVVRGGAVTPVLVSGPSGALAAPEVAAPAVPLTADEAAALRQVMRTVVTDGTAIELLDVPGEPVGAKSGTAEHGTEDPPLTSAWMIGFQGDLAFAVFVEVGAYGAGTSGPLLEAFLRGAQ